MAALGVDPCRANHTNGSPIGVRPLKSGQVSSLNTTKMTITLNIDIDMSCIDTEDLIDELQERTLKSRETEALLDILGIEAPFDTSRLSLPDKEKYDLFFENFDKISLQQIEALIK